MPGLATCKVASLIDAEDRRGRDVVPGTLVRHDFDERSFGIAVGRTAPHGACVLWVHPPNPRKLPPTHTSWPTPKSATWYRVGHDAIETVGTGATWRTQQGWQFEGEEEYAAGDITRELIRHLRNNGASIRHHPLDADITVVRRTYELPDYYVEWIRCGHARRPA